MRHHCEGRAHAPPDPDQNARWLTAPQATLDLGFLEGRSKRHGALDTKRGE